METGEYDSPPAWVWASIQAIFTAIAIVFMSVGWVSRTPPLVICAVLLFISALKFDTGDDVLTP